MNNETPIKIETLEFDPSEQEVISSNLGDKRLDERLKMIIRAFEAKPQASIPEAMGQWSGSKAAYRFFDNPKVTSEKILKPHQAALAQRIGREKILLAIQDTSMVDYTNHPQTKNLGCLGDENHQGIILHPTLLSTAAGIPMGLIDIQFLKREQIGSRENWAKRSIEEKESMKWLNSYRATFEFAKEHPQHHLINIADREGDVYELFQEALDNKQQFGCQLDVLVRAAWNRKLMDQHGYLWDYLESQPIVAKNTLQLPRRNERPARRAKLSIRCAAIQLRPPRRRKKSFIELRPIQLWAIYLKEDHPPKNAEPITWMLLTTITINDAAQALDLVEYYVRRWLIEIYFKILKSGCLIEERQLQAEHRLINCLTVDSIIAWRILFLTMLGRSLPELPATVLFQRAEYTALFLFLGQNKKILPTTPSLGQVIFAIATLGGFLARSRDRFPGVVSIWRGMWRLSDITASWKIFTASSVQLMGKG